MQAIIDVYRMEEVSPETRAKIIIKLGKAINYQLGANITEELVYELVGLLVPDHPILSNRNYLMYVGEQPNDT